MDESRAGPTPPHLPPRPASSDATPGGRGRRGWLGGGGGVPLGRLFGFPVRLSLSWLLLAALVTLAYGQFLADTRADLAGPVPYAVAFGLVVCLVVSVLLHELGHAFASRRAGIGVRGITLEMLGGYTEMEHEAPTPRVELVVALAGPAVSLVLGLLAAGAASVLPYGGLARPLAVQLALANLVVGVFNALPGLPLDGGRALQAVVWKVTGNPYLGRQVAGWVGRLIAVASVVVVLTVYSEHLLAIQVVFTLFMALAIWTGATQAIRQGSIGAAIPRLDLAALTRPVVAVGGDTPLAEAERLATASGLPRPVLVVVDAAGQLISIVSEAAAHAVPLERRPWIATADVARILDPAHVLPPGLSGMDLLYRVQADPTGDYLVASDEDVFGVLRGAELVAMLQPGRRNRS
jgi:Zn-dependent protease